MVGLFVFFANHCIFTKKSCIPITFDLPYAEVIYPLFIKQASLNKKGIEYLSILNKNECRYYKISRITLEFLAATYVVKLIMLLILFDMWAFNKLESRVALKDLENIAHSKSN